MSGSSHSFQANFPCKLLPIPECSTHHQSFKTLYFPSSKVCSLLWLSSLSVIPFSWSRRVWCTLEMLEWGGSLDFQIWPMTALAKFFRALLLILQGSTLNILLLSFKIHFLYCRVSKTNLMRPLLYLQMSSHVWLVVAFITPLCRGRHPNRVCYYEIYTEIGEGAGKGWGSGEIMTEEKSSCPSENLLWVRSRDTIWGKNRVGVDTVYS